MMMNEQKAICNACTVGHGCKCPDSPHTACKAIAEENIHKAKLKKENDAKMERTQFEEQVSNAICGTNRLSAVEAVNQKDVVNKPKYYCHGLFEVIDEMVIVLGVDSVIEFCKCNAWKYRCGAPYKGNKKEDNTKADWYLNKAKELQEGKIWQE